MPTNIRLTHNDLNKKIAVLLSRFGMTDEQAVALMGAHTLGYAHRQNSGFRNVKLFSIS